MSGFRRPTFVVLLGLGLVVAGVQFAHFGELTEFTYSVEDSTEAAAVEAANESQSGTTAVYEFDELPGTAQNAFVRAYGAADGTITIRGMEHQVTALGHAADTTAQPGGGRYYVEYRGSYYEFTIRHPMQFTGFSFLLGYGLAAVGILLGINDSLQRESRTGHLLAFGSGVVAFLAVYATTGWWGLNDFPSLLVAGALCAYLPTVGVWSVYESRHS